ncbi:NAD(P)-binding protein [Ophiobolus disseminans]|uniref:NAD(P)-binding protein n=1 Tax=Ophiobolus disseminans TaxID=1469910 RepID=A0A6A7A2L2_9PLEO|nr:NAD(P)-binding protein [Ophiobolus disseminans]
MTATNSAPKKVLMFGVTGLIGQYIFQEIYNAQSSFEKIGFFTSKSTATNKPDEVNGWKEKGVEVIVGDVNSEDDVAKAYEGYDTVISALGRNAILSQIPLIKIAEASSSINFFYPSEYGTDIEYNASSADEKPHQLKLQVRKYIRENVKKLKVTYLVTGPYSDLYFGKSSEPQAGTFDVKAKKATLLGTGEEKISFTTEKDVGRLLVAALKTPTTEHQRILKVNSFTVTSKEVLAEFEKQTGAKWEVSYTPIDVLKKAEKEAWEKDSPVKTVYTLRRIWNEGGTLYEESDNGKIGFKGTETVEEQIRKIIKKQS